MTEPFWPWCPSRGAARNTTLAVDQVDLGDGYIHRVTRGLNPTRPSWSLQFPFRDLGELDQMNDFLEANAAHGFYFKPPDEDVPELFVCCNSWSATIIDRTAADVRVGQLQTEFARCYNPQPIDATVTLGASMVSPPPLQAPQMVSQTQALQARVLFAGAAPVGVSPIELGDPNMQPRPDPTPNMPYQPTEASR